MMTLSGLRQEIRFRFSVDTAAWNSLQRETSWRWPQQERVGAGPALQYVGPGEETMTLDGVIFPHYRNAGSNQINSMREQAGLGQPFILTTGTGQALGQWVIESISETQTEHLPGGIPLKQEFSLQLQRFDYENTQND